MSGQKYEEQQLNQQINDKLNQLWTGMKVKRKQILKNLTPSYSRRTDQSQLQHSTANYQVQHQLLQIRQKLGQEVVQRKKRDIQIEKLKKTITQLTNDKKMLILELQQIQSDEGILNESSINGSKVRLSEGKTANFSTSKKDYRKTKNIGTIEQQPDETIAVDNYQYSTDKLAQLSKQRLLQLLRSTAQYRQFVFYYDSNQLSYLKRLQEQHRKNCDHSISQKQKQFWAPTEIVQQFIHLNKQQKWGLNDYQIQYILSKMKFYYERNLQQKITKLKSQYEYKNRKMQRQNQYGIPYDIIQICKAKQRQLSKTGKKRTIVK